MLFVIAILGCGEGDAPCREVRLDSTRYASEAACVAQTGPALMRHTDLSFPQVVARCRPAGARSVLLRGSDVLRPQPGRIPPLRIASARP